MTTQDPQALLPGLPPLINVNTNWVPITTNVVRTNADSSISVVQQIVDFYGGTGRKPTYIDYYIGELGYVLSIDDATDIKGRDGILMSYRYANNISSTVPPSITNVLNPIGWTISPSPINIGEYRWKVQGFIGVENQLIGNWSDPIVDSFIDAIAPESSDEIFDI